MLTLLFEKRLITNLIILRNGIPKQPDDSKEQGFGYTRSSNLKNS